MDRGRDAWIMHEWTHGWMSKMDEWLDGLMGKWIDGRVEGWMEDK